MNFWHKIKEIERYCKSPLSKQEYKDLWSEWEKWNYSDYELVFYYNQLQQNRFTDGFTWDNLPKNEIKWKNN